MEPDVVYDTILAWLREEGDQITKQNLQMFSRRLRHLGIVGVEYPQHQTRRQHPRLWTMADALTIYACRLAQQRGLPVTAVYRKLGRHVHELNDGQLDRARVQQLVEDAI